MPSGNLSILTLTVIASAAVEANRFVNQAGAYPAAGAIAFGVTRSSGAIGDPLPVDVQGTTIIECAGTIAADAAVMSDADGKAVAATVGAKVPLARAMEAGTAGGFIEILLIPNAGLTTAAS
jgi:hypothetical protein